MCVTADPVRSTRAGTFDILESGSGSPPKRTNIPRTHSMDVMDIEDSLESEPTTRL